MHSNVKLLFKNQNIRSFVHLGFKCNSLIQMHTINNFK